jgi:hypothetical protein
MGGRGAGRRVWAVGRAMRSPTCYPVNTTLSRVISVAPHGHPARPKTSGTLRPDFGRDRAMMATGNGDGGWAFRRPCTETVETREKMRLGRPHPDPERRTTLIFTATPLPGAWVIDLERRGDDRGFFARTFCAREFAEHGLATEFVQGNMSLSANPARCGACIISTRPPRRPSSCAAFRARCGT